MNLPAELIAAWRAEERAPFSGWDFSHLAGRMIEEQPPWSYIARARELLRGAKAALDIGTGGGERLLEMRPDWPRLMVAAEEYPPNVLISARRLAAEGGHVVAAPANEVEPLPFVDGAFDCVLNRHSAIHVPEIARVLTPGGVFFTQQVHGLWAEDLLAEFGARPQWPDATPQRYVPALEAAGLEVTHVQEWRGRLRFTDVGALVYYLKAVSWSVVGFSVDAHLQTLLRLQSRLDRGEELAFTARSYIMEAAKPAAL